jgi:hypothetical protein
MTQKLIVETTPLFHALAEKMGYDIENEEINEAHVLHQQAIETETEVFEPGERFRVKGDQRKVYIVLDDNKYIPLCHLEYNSFVEDFIESTDIVQLEDGDYYFHEDGITIEFVRYLEENNE